MKIFTRQIFGTFALLMFGGFAFGQTPFWTEDFDGALPADWSAIEVVGDGMTASNWMWTTVGPTGAFSIDPIASTTATNGWMIFDSDLNCSGAQDVWLMAPKMDMSTRDEVTLQFESYYRRYGDTVTVMVSIDSLAWTEFKVYNGIATNQFGDGTVTGATNPDLVTINISSAAANQPQVWFALRFRADATNGVPNNPPGCAYSWQVDDMALFDVDLTPSVDISLGDFFYTPASFAQPVSQVATDTFGFFADISNVGADPVTNVVLKAIVSDDAGNVLFTDSLVIDEIAPGVTDSTFTIDALWGPDVPVGVYDLAYEVYSLDAPDATPNNNVNSDPWLVTDDLWSKEDGTTTAYRPGGDPADWIVGNLYTTSSNLVDDYEAIEVSFFSLKAQANGSLLGDQVKIILVEIDEAELGPGWGGFDDNLDFLSNPALDLRSINEHTYTTNGQQATESLTLEDFSTEEPGVLLKPGNRYLLLASYEGDNNVIFHGFSEEINYFQISTVVYTDQWFLGGFGVEPAATLRLRIQLASTSDATDRTLPDDVLSYYPNPANEYLNVELNFEKPEVVNVTLADLDGRVIRLDEMVNTTQAFRQYDVSDLPAGTYLVRVATKEGTITKKFVVAR